MFSKSFIDFVSRSNDPEITADFNWFTGNYGIIRKLRTSELVAVLPDRAMPEGFTSDKAALQAQERKFQQAILSRFVDPLSDDEVPKEFKSHMSAIRDIAAQNGCTDSSVPLVRRIKHGRQYSMKLFAPLCGHCNQDFSYLQNWDFDDSVTESSKKGKEFLVFGGPFLLKDSEQKTMREQEELLAKVTNGAKLPFKLIHGSVALDTLVIQSHELLTGEKHPLNSMRVRTGTISSCGNRLYLRRDGDGCLYCGSWLWDDGGRDDDLGCLALGVVVLGH